MRSKRLFILSPLDEGVEGQGNQIDGIIRLPHKVILRNRPHRGWLNSHCVGYYANEYEEWYFEHVQDAVLAKLRYG
jgi:hypothetical protein